MPNYSNNTSQLYTIIYNSYGIAGMFPLRRITGRSKAGQFRDNEGILTGRTAVTVKTTQGRRPTGRGGESRRPGPVPFLKHTAMPGPTLFPESRHATPAPVIIVLTEVRARRGRTCIVIGREVEFF
jgi:hypothetical protein